MDDHQGPRVDYLRLLRRVLRNRWRIMLISFAAISAPILVSAYFIPKIYEAAATIFIEDPRKLGPHVLREWMPTSDTAFQIAVLRSRSLAETVVENLPRQTMQDLQERSMSGDYLLDAQHLFRRLLGRAPVVHSPHQRALAELQRSRVRFAAMPSGEVEIRTYAYDPRVAMELANTHVEVLQNRVRSSARDEARATREFIQGLLAQTKAAQQELEEALATRMRGSGGVKLPQQTSLEAAKIAQLETSLADVEASKQIAQARLNHLRGTRERTREGREGAPVGPELPRVARLEDRLAALREKYTEQHPLVRGAQADIAESQRTAPTAPAVAESRAAPASATAARAPGSPQHPELEAEIVGLEAKEQVLKRRINSLTRDLTTLTGEEMETLKLHQKLEAQRTLNQSLSEKLGTVRIQEQGEGRGLRVIDLAAMPLVPSGSAVNKRILLGLLLGLGLGVGVAACIEFLNQPIETVDELTSIADVPVLGWLPAVGHPAARGERSGPPLRFSDASGPLPFALDRCRSIRTSLELLARQRPFRTVMVASASPREGKSTVLLNLGWAFTEIGRRPIIVDSDLRRPVLHRVLPAGSHLGLADVLASGAAWEQVGQRLDDRLWLLPAGSGEGVTPSAILNAENVNRLFDFLQVHGDVILFDSAPILAVSDNLLLASMVDGVILVVRAGHTQRRDLLRAKDQLDKVGAVLLGVVLNEVSRRETQRFHARYAEYYEALAPTSQAPAARPRASWWQGRRSPAGKSAGGSA